ncbi:NF-kappa-B inhibitor-interacting Ras-like protein 1 isoform X1 [Lagopus muta]|uniref:NF-kappa-B inhibitor-interacting Ras-like protein 1 isoform X1 n=1 Tax=Lagopus muta TaxID=64668 RepID=UPI00209DB488|nr:NF-kappa-B inhibitor-interacting Ras-like protein 1 isoform X1 [Lagopus muta]
MCAQQGLCPSIPSVTLCHIGPARAHRLLQAARWDQPRSQPHTDPEASALPYASDRSASQFCLCRPEVPCVSRSCPCRCRPRRTAAFGQRSPPAGLGTMGKGYKVVVCGMASVGKTAILEQLLYGKHTVGLEEGATMEDVYLASVETDRGVKEQLRLYDTRGLQEGVELPKHYFSVADGFILVYAITSLEAFQRVEQLKKEIDIFRDKKEVTVIILGNKTDLLEQRQVETEAAQQWARAEKVRLWEVTVTDRKTLLEPFTFLASKLSQSQNKSTFPLPGRKSKGNNCDN